MAHARRAPSSAISLLVIVEVRDQDQQAAARPIGGPPYISAPVPDRRMDRSNRRKQSPQVLPAVSLRKKSIAGDETDASPCPAITCASAAGDDGSVAELRLTPRGNAIDALVSSTIDADRFVVSRNCFVYRRSVRANSFQSTYLRSSPGR